MCAADELFTNTYCYNTLDGTMTGLTSEQADVDVEGHHLTAPVAIAGPIDDVRGDPVRVTIYRGKVIHIEGSGMRFEAQDSPAAIFEFFLDSGLFAVFGGAGLVGIGLLMFLRRKPPPTTLTQDSGSA